MELPEKITTEVQYPQWYHDRDWPGEQQERAYLEAHRAMRDLYGPKVPEELHDFIFWLDAKIEEASNGNREHF